MLYCSFATFLIQTDYRDPDCKSEELRLQVIESLYRRAIEADPDHVIAQGNFAAFLLTLDDKEKVEEGTINAMVTKKIQSTNLNGYSQDAICLTEYYMWRICFLHTRSFHWSVGFICCVTPTTQTERMNVYSK